MDKRKRNEFDQRQRAQMKKEQERERDAKMELHRKQMEEREREQYRKKVMKQMEHQETTTKNNILNKIKQKDTMVFINILFLITDNQIDSTCF